MRIHQPSRLRSRRGAALLLAVLLLLVLVAIVFQINVATSTQARVGRNEIGLSSMDLSIESALLEVYDKLKLDGEGASDSASSAGGQGQGQDPAMPGGTGGGGAAGGAGSSGDQAAACDSRRDEWARPARTEINEIKLRILIQDEDSKVNVLTMLAEDPKEAQAAFDRVVRVIDKYREGTRVDVDSGQAEEMARAMLEYMTKGGTDLARATQLSADPNKKELRLPRSLREFQVLSPFEPLHFRDFRDEDGARVHSLESFLTVWTALITAADSPNAAQNTAAAGAGNTNSQSRTGGNTSGGNQSTGANQSSGTGQKASSGQNPSGSGSGTGGAGSGGSGSGSGGAGSGNAGSGAGAGGGSGSSSGASEAGGWQVNINTAPVAVLKSLFEDREVPQRFWDEVIEYRNLPEEEEENSSAEDSEEEPLLDEFGREIVNYRIFESLQELEEIDGYSELSAEAKTKIQASLTVTSNVFSVYVVARRVTSVEDGSELMDDPQALEEAEEKGDSLVRVVRSVVWRHQDAEESLVITPVLRWEVLDTIPREVQDFPEERR